MGWDQVGSDEMGMSGTGRWCTLSDIVAQRGGGWPQYPQLRLTVHEAWVVSVRYNAVRHSGVAKDGIGGSEDRTRGMGGISAVRCGTTLRFGTMRYDTVRDGMC